MTSLRYTLLAAIIIYLDVSSIIVTAAAIMWNPKISRYVNSYNLDKGPVFYEAYYPDVRDAYQEKRFDRNTVLETSFQIPLERFTYSAKTADHPISINESFVVVDNEEVLPRERKAVTSQPYYDAITNRLASFTNERSRIFDNNKNSQLANIEEISKLVRRAISRDLENWNALEGYIDRTIQQDDEPMPQLGTHSKKIHENMESDIFLVNHESRDSSERPSISKASLPRKLNKHNEKQPIHFEIDANGSTITSDMRVSGTQVVDTSPSVDVISDSLPPKDIFQPRPQLIKYIFFKKPVLPRDKPNDKPIDDSTPRTFGDNPIREEIANDNRNRRIEENVKVTSIEISELPRHKTRHHHGEWPQRDYSSHHHRSQSAKYPTVS